MLKNKGLKKVLWVLLTFGLLENTHAGSADFVFSIDTRFSTDNESFTIPIYGEGYKYDVDCDDDGVFEALSQEAVYICDYGAGGGGEKTIVIRDSNSGVSGFPRFRFDQYGEAIELLELNQWGAFSWDSMDSAFEDAVNLEFLATDVPDLVRVSSTRDMFRGAVLADPDTSGWNTANVMNMTLMFFDASSANPDTSGWNTANVIDMGGMFQNANMANPDTSGWDTSNVQRMDAMFRFATSANPDTSGWNTSNVTQMNEMFRRADMANPDTSNWDTSNVMTMVSMFRSADSANPDTSGWNTSRVTNMSFMFAFNDIATPDTSSWDISAVTSMEGMFDRVTLPTEAYDSILNSFGAQVVQSNVLFDGGNSVYCDTAARDILINNYGWIITDGGPLPECDVIFKNSFDVPVSIFTANSRWFEYEFGLFETVDLDSYPKLIGVGLDQDNQAIIKFHIRKKDQQLQMRISDLDLDAFEADTWIHHQWQNINNSDLTGINW